MLKSLCRMCAAGLLLLAFCASASVVTDGSGTVAVAGTSQQVFASRMSRTYLMCQNPIGALTPLFVNIDAAAATTGGSYELAPGGSVTFSASGFMPTGAINVTSATASARFICKQG